MTLIVRVLLLPGPDKLPTNPTTGGLDKIGPYRNINQAMPPPRLPVQPLCTRRLRRRWERTGNRSIYNIALRIFLRASISLASSVWISYLNPSDSSPHHVFSLSSNLPYSI